MTFQINASEWQSNVDAIERFKRTLATDLASSMEAPPVNAIVNITVEEVAFPVDGQVQATIRFAEPCPDTQLYGQAALQINGEGTDSQ